MKDINPYQNKALIRKKRIRGTLYGAGLVAILIISILFVYYFQHKQLHNKQVMTEKNELQQMATAIKQELFMVGSDLSYFSYNPLTLAILQHPDPEKKQYLTDLMVNISSIQNRYDKLRILDKTGQEIIRINYRGSEPPCEEAPKNLQNKADRYYFTITRTLAPKEIYTSPFDLNMENGAIEQPFKPMLRFSTPIYSKTGTFLGVGILNYLGNRLLTKLQKIRAHTTNPFFVLNQEGHCIKGQHPEQEWLFMLQKDRPPLFPQMHPDVWQRITTQHEGEFSNQNGHFFFIHINCAPPPPFKAANTPSLIIILHAPRHQLVGKTTVLTLNLTKGFLLLAPLMAFLGWKLGTYQVHQKYLFSALQYEASHDPLTDLFNRKAIHNILDRSIALTLRQRTNLALGYLDVDGLKKVNDELGHEAGDQLIKGASTAIATIIRDSDSAARVGGDEFIIVFPDCNAQNATVVLERIKLNFAGQGLEKTGDKWQISVGCAELLAEDSQDSLIERADKMMYRNKHLAKTIVDDGNTSTISS